MNTGVTVTDQPSFNGKGLRTFFDMSLHHCYANANTTALGFLAILPSFSAEPLALCGSLVFPGTSVDIYPPTNSFCDEYGDCYHQCC